VFWSAPENKEVRVTLSKETRERRQAERQKRAEQAKRKKKRTKSGGAIVSITPAAAGIIFDGDSLDEWSDEELMRGKRRMKNGKFNGRDPQVIPFELHKELTRRRMSRAHDLLADSLVDAAQMLRSVVNDEEASTMSRIRAAELMFDRVLGKPRESVELDLGGQGAPWQRLVAGAIVGTVEEAGLILDRERSLAEQDIVDAEIVEEADDDDE
jgi:hypothetical protein